MRDRFPASHPDDPTAPFADRLLLALGMWPTYPEQLGEEAVLKAASSFRWDAHRFPMACEDFGTQADEIERLRAAITEAVRTLEEEASSECVCLMVADDLNDVLKGATDDD